MGPVAAVGYCHPCTVATFSQGHRVEDHARRGAAVLGVPDFVYYPEKQVRGRTGGNREVGDGLLVAGEAGLIVQSKSRLDDSAANETPERAEQWCRKHARKGQSQAAGTRRTIQRGGVYATSLRGYRRLLPQFARWAGVVIIDQQNVSAIEFPASTDTLYITLDDWLQLHFMIRSTAGIIDYVERALDSGVTVALGDEADRFVALARADLEACTTLSQFPTLYAGQLSGEEELSVAAVDALVERVADPANRGFDPGSYLGIVEQLDRIPIVGRARLGSKMRQTASDVADDGKSRSFIVIDSDLGPGLRGNRLAFIYNRFNFLVHGIEGHYFNAEVAGYAATRQLQALRNGADTESGTLAVGVLIDRKLGPRYTFVFISGAPNIPDEIAVHFASKYGTLDGRSIR
ncbi:hypothetical protein NFA_23800 [Nocardia farcinica IFM 10152]|uniref:Uncharacterized protein n=1 Tax=Nocardia farcinica (strain IFM 10152) TaxID=247156 RepID=Q5YX64_NOCFA|nr:hypothetical protein NFA_23800 [Nocardia farcinica IFM 10152]